MANRESPVPIGAFFYNTTYDFSRMDIDTPFPGSTSEAKMADPEEWVNVSQYGVTGDGSDETAKVQSVLDDAAAGAIKSKVLIPAGMNVKVSATHIDGCFDGITWAQMWVALYIDPGVSLRIDGKITLITRGTDAYYSNPDGVAVIANRNSFRAVQGISHSSYTSIYPSGFTGDTQGVIDCRVHTNGSASTVLQVTGSPDLGSIVAGDFIPIPNLVQAVSPLRVCVRGSTPRFTDIVAVDNTAKTITVADSYTIASGSAKAFYVENNYLDENIFIEGNGTIDCNCVNGGTSGEWGWAWAFRIYRTRNFRINGINVIGHYGHGAVVGFSEYTTIRDTTFQKCGESLDSELAFDVCQFVTVDNCVCVGSVGRTLHAADFKGMHGIDIFASKDVTINNCKILYHNQAGGQGIWTSGGFGYEYVETVLGANETDSKDKRIIWRMAVGPNPVSSSYANVEWDWLFSGNIIKNNKTQGMDITTETFYGNPGKSIKIVENVINNNGDDGIALNTQSYGAIIEKNTIKNNGWVTGNTFYLD